MRLEGRLGNQLFQYAFIYAVSRQLNVQFYVDKSIEPFLLPKYFNVPSGSLIAFDKLFTIRGFKNLFSHHLRRGFYDALKNYHRLKELVFSDSAPVMGELSKVADQVLYNGYFQSEAYFLNYREEIKNLFAIHDQYQDGYRQIAEKVIPPGKKIVTVHFRRGDYVNLNLILPLEYYRKAIESIDEPGNFYIIISDDPGVADEQFRYLENKYISHHKDIIDFQFLINADSCILSNSSFSWWGAYLNKRDAKVLVPRFWSGAKLGYEYPAGIISAHWTQI